MDQLTIWHNPRCSKSREVLSIIEKNGYDKEIVKYLETPPSTAEIKNILKMLALPARELMRTKEALYKELRLKEEQDEEKLIEAMAQNPKLIERPIVIKSTKAIIGRPTSIVEDFLKS